MKTWILLTTILSFNLKASPGLGYSGRLVKSDGTPVTGTVNLSFELNYSGDTATILCEETINSVALQNGVYSVSLNFTSGGGACDLASVIKNIPGGQTLDIRVHDLTNSLTFNYQSIHSSPKAYISDFALDVLDGVITPAKISTTGASNGDVLTFSAGAWSFVAPSGSGISSLGGLTGGTQTLATGTSGTAPAFSSAGSTHTLNIPMASSSGVTAGLISKTDYDNFTSGSGFASRTLTAGTGLTGGGDLSADRTFNVDVGVINGKIAQVGAGDKLDVSIIPNLEGGSNACASGEKLISNGLGGFSCGSHTVTAGTGLTGGGALTTNRTLSVDTGTTNGKIPVIGAGDKLPSSILDDTSKLPLAGGSMTGDIDLNGNDLQNAGALSLNGSTSGSVTVTPPATVTTYTLTLPDSKGSSGQVLKTDGNGVTSWTTITPGSGTVTSVGTSGGLTGGPITGTGTLSIAAGGVGTTQLAGDAVTSTKIKDGEIVNADISSSAAIVYSKLSISDGDFSIAKTSGLQTALDAKLALAGGTMSGNIAMGSNKISGLPTPVAGDEVATKAYVDASAPDLSDIKTKTSGTYNRDQHSLEALRERLDALEIAVSSLSGSGGGSSTLSTGAYFFNGGSPSYCSKRVLSNYGESTDSFVNIGSECDINKRCDNSGNCSAYTSTIASNGRRMFLTGTTNGNLGGISGADSTCNSLASAAGLGGTYKAFLSTSLENAFDHINALESDIFYSEDSSANQTVVAYGKSDFLNTYGNGNYIRTRNFYNENGTTSGIGTYVWTGTAIDGTSDSFTCSDWTSGTSGVAGAYGRPRSYQTYRWLNESTLACSNSQSFLCIED